MTSTESAPTGCNLLVLKNDQLPVGRSVVMGAARAHDAIFGTRRPQRIDGIPVPREGELLRALISSERELWPMDLSGHTSWTLLVDIWKTPAAADSDSKQFAHEWTLASEYPGDPADLQSSASLIDVVTPSRWPEFRPRYLHVPLLFWQARGLNGADPAALYELIRAELDPESVHGLLACLAFRVPSADLSKGDGLLLALIWHRQTNFDVFMNATGLPKVLKLATERLGIDGSDSPDGRPVPAIGALHDFAALPGLGNRQR